MGKQGQAARSTKQPTVDVLCSFSRHNIVIYSEALAQFHIRNKEPAQTKQHCNQIIKKMLAIEYLAEFMEEAYQTGVALYIMSCHNLMASTIMEDLEG